MIKLPTELLDALPQGAEATFERLFPERPASNDMLAGLIRKHLEVVDEASTGSSDQPYVDAHLARVIADRLLKLFESWELLSPVECAVVHATVHYFVLNEDAEGDLRSPIGFEDDAQVANACFDYLGRPDLRIDME